MQNPRKRWTVGFWVFLFNLVLAVLAVYTFLSFTESPLGAPRWVTERIEDDANAALPTGSLSIGNLALQISDAGLPSVGLGNIAIFDARGVEVARINRAAVRLRVLDVLRGQVRPREVALTGGQITLRRLSDGTLDLSFGGTSGASGSAADLLDSFDRLFDQPMMANVREISASDLTIGVEDARSGRVWQITDGQMLLRQVPGGLDMALNFEVFNGTEDLAEVHVALTTSRQDAGGTLRARFVNAAARDIAVQSPVLSFLSVLDAPISGALSTDFSADGEISGLAGTLEIGKGALQPTPGARPLPFNTARAYFTFDPSRSRISFTELSVDAPQLRARSTGQAYLREFINDWPSALVAQFRTQQLELRTADFLEAPLTINNAAADMRLRLDPFELTVGQVSVQLDDALVTLSGQVVADAAGWHVAADGQADRLTVPQLLALWPQQSLPGTRLWIAENLPAGEFHDLKLATRARAGQIPVFELGFGFADAAIKVMESFPPIEQATGYGSLGSGGATFLLEGGRMTAPIGGDVLLDGSSFQIPDLSARPAQAVIDLFASGATEGIVSLLALPPINALAGSGLDPDFASGTADLRAHVTYPMTPDRPAGSLRYEMAARISQARSDVLIPGKTLDLATVDVVARNGFLSAEGPFRIGAVTGQGKWQNPGHDDGRPGSAVSGTVMLSQAFVDEFGIGLPDGFVSGAGAAAFTVDLVPKGPPTFVLSSDLDGVALAVPQISWTKSAAQTGDLKVAGLLGTRPEVSELTISAPGLSLSDGRVTLRDDGTLDAATFGSASAGDWYQGSLQFEGRGAGLAPRIVARGDRLDLRRANFASGGGNGSAGGPLEVALGRLQITDSISLTEVSSSIDLSRGMAGTYSGRVNGETEVQGRLETVRNGVAVRMTSVRGGEVIRDAGIFPSANGGDFDLILRPMSEGGRYRGTLTLKNTEVRGAPVLTELLSALSIVGLLDQLRGAGIVFSDVTAQFILRDTEVELLASSAIGPSLGISLDGRYDAVTSTLSMQGVISPIYFLNAIGRLVSARDGEGLIGFSFQLVGPSDAPSVRVNALSVLTPGFLRDIFRKPDKQDGE